MLVSIPFFLGLNLLPLSNLTDSFDESARFKAREDKTVSSWSLGLAIRGTCLILSNLVAGAGFVDRHLSLTWRKSKVIYLLALFLASLKMLLFVYVVSLF